MEVRKKDNFEADVLLSSTIHVQMGEYTEAISETKKVIELNPNSWLAYLNLGRALFRSGSVNDAIRSLETGLKIVPKDDPFYWSPFSKQDKDPRLDNMNIGQEGMFYGVLADIESYLGNTDRQDYFFDKNLKCGVWQEFLWTFYDGPDDSFEHYVKGLVLIPSIGCRDSTDIVVRLGRGVFSTAEAEMFYKIGNNKLDKQQCRIALKCFEQSQFLCPNIKSYQDSLYSAKEELVSESKVLLGDKTKTLLLEALVKIEEGDYLTALDFCNHAVDINPNDGYVYLCRSLVMKLCGRDQSAEKDKIAHITAPFQSDYHIHYALVEAFPQLDIKQRIRFIFPSPSEEYEKIASNLGIAQLHFNKKIILDFKIYPPHNSVYVIAPTCKAPLAPEFLMKIAKLLGSGNHSLEQPHFKTSDFSGAAGSYYKAIESILQQKCKILESDIKKNISQMTHNEYGVVVPISEEILSMEKQTQTGIIRENGLNESIFHIKRAERALTDFEKYGTKGDIYRYITVLFLYDLSSLSPEQFRVIRDIYFLCEKRNNAIHGGIISHSEAEKLKEELLDRNDGLILRLLRFI